MSWNTVVPNVEKDVIAHLLASEELTDLLGENRVSTEIPANATFPRVRIVLSGGTVAVERWLFQMRIVVEGWGDTKDDAFAACTTALSVLQSLRDSAQVQEGVVTSSELDGGVLWAPDPETEKPRYLGSVSIHIHPNSGA